MEQWKVPTSTQSVMSQVPACLQSVEQFVYIERVILHYTAQDFTETKQIENKFTLLQCFGGGWILGFAAFLNSTFSCAKFIKWQLIQV